MSRKRTSRRMSSREKLVRTFFRAMAITFIMCCILVGGVAWAYQTFIFDGGTQSDERPSIAGSLAEEEEEEIIEEESVNKNIAVFGTDGDGYRTDVIFVVNFNSETGKVKVVSVPRDTKVEWSTEQQDLFREMKGYTRTVSKINEMSAYAGMSNIRDFTVTHLESLFGIKIDNYVVVTLDAFRKIVDAIDGVEVDVPMDMYYVDPYQDLYIDIDKGLQTLDGEKAEHLVRFRSGYVDGDEGRIRTQQLFMEAFMEKVLSPSIITKIPQLVTVLFTSVTTDIELGEILPYYSYVSGFDINNLEFHTLVGEAQYQNGISYFIADMDEIQNFSDAIFYEHLMEEVVEDDAVDGEPEIEEVIIDKEVSIEVLNGSGVNGAAANAKATLEAEGYAVNAIGNYGTGFSDETQIIVKDFVQAEQFKTYYPTGVIIQDSTLAYDVQIVLGRY